MKANNIHIPVEKLVKGKIPVLFLDYDGTLTPIVNQPEDAVLSPGMKKALEECAARFSVAVISGRDMDDLKNMVKIEDLIYAGSHGFRISGPRDLYKEHEKSREIVRELDKIGEQVEKSFSPEIKGVRIERKRYAIAVHYRNANEAAFPGIERKVNAVVEMNPGFKTGGGKKILEIKPDVDWHKGKAVRWIMEKLGVQDRNKYVPIYIGDDLTDEDAFRTIAQDGIGILVGTHGQPTAAKYKLEDVAGVKSFLLELAHATAV